MVQRTPQELEQINRLAEDLRVVINRAQVHPQIAVDALASAFGNVLIQVSESEERLAEYLEEMRDNALREWRKRKGTGS
jgi:hypothetical protein